MNKLKEMLIKHEGKRNKVYLCSAGKRTIGIGHNIDANSLPEDIAIYLKKYGVITEDMIDSLYDIDITNAINDCYSLYPDFDNFSENRKNALIDFLFNVGITVAKTFRRTNSYINKGLWKSAGESMKKSKWYRQVGKRGVEITNLVING